MPDTSIDIDLPTQVSLQELKAKSPTDLLAYAEMLEVENASSLRTQDMLFAILKELAEQDGMKERKKDSITEKCISLRHRFNLIS